jgi:membrane protein DedA with SNARE-associated domain
MESFLASHVYLALILFGFLEAACIPISSEITFGFAGVLAYQGHISLASVIIIGSLAELAGSYASYFIGRLGGRPLVHKLGRYVLVTESDLNRAERFLEGRGAWAVPVGRMLPFVRAFTSIVAGLVRLPAARFGVLSLIGTVIYASVLASIGYEVGSAWQSVSKGLSVAGYILFALIVIVIVAFVVYRLRQFRREDQLRRSGTPLPASGVPGSGVAGPGVAGSGVPGSGAAGSGAAGSGVPGPGVAGSGVAGSGVPGPGVAGPGGPGVPGSGVAGPGTGSGPAFAAGPADGSAAQRPAKPHSHRAS